MAAAMAMAAAGSGLWRAASLRRRCLDPGAGEADSGAAERRRRQERPRAVPGGLRAAGDEGSRGSISAVPGRAEEAAEGGDLPAVAELMDERPEGVKWMEELRASKKWKPLGDHDEELQRSAASGDAKPNRSGAAKQTPPRRGHHEAPDPLRSAVGRSVGPEGGHQRQQGGSDLSPPRRKRHGSDTDLLPPQKQMASLAGQRKPGYARGATLAAKKPQRHDSESGSDSGPSTTSAKASLDSDLSPPRASRCSRLQGSPDLSPPRRNRHGSSGSDSSPPRRGQEVRQKACRSLSPPDLSPPRRARDSKGRGSSERDPQMLSGGKAGLVSADLLRREQQEFRKQESGSRHLEDKSQHAATVFRDKSGRKRDLKQERLEQQKAAQQKSERDEQYARWGKGLAQSRQQQRNLEDAIKEMQKPLARHIDDQDLDRMLREQEREGDPMASFIKKRKSKEGNNRKEKPKYRGPAPPLNRFTIWPGYRWDGVDRSSGFEQKRFARIASKKAVQELAYKWGVEDM